MWTLIKLCVFAPEDDTVIGAHMEGDRCDKESFNQLQSHFIVMGQYISRRKDSVVLKVKLVGESLLANTRMFREPKQMLYHCF